MGLNRTTSLRLIKIGIACIVGILIVIYAISRSLEYSRGPSMKNLSKEFSGKTIIAGGDTIDVACRYGNLEDYSHVSLAGGATLEFLAGKELPALKALIEEKK